MRGERRMVRAGRRAVRTKERRGRGTEEELRA